jgi:hypothetical protein
MGIRTISRKLGVARNTVRTIIEKSGEVNLTPRSDKISVDPELLTKLYTDCSGWRERIWEKLQDEYNVQIAYSTLTLKVRELGLGKKPRSAHIGDTPGGEMQHDTSPYRIKIDDKTTGIIASLLYFRYSKQRYLKFYRSFTRFKMRCFFHEALVHFGFSATECIIDNTNLAILHGTGPDAVINPEMEKFSRMYGFRFVAHRIKHANRKAGEERSFWTVETNFFAGRTFTSLEDLNQQAYNWSTNIMANRPQTKGRIIPSKAFEHEAAFLNKIHEEIPAPYQVHVRNIDQYGFIAFDSNYYWLPIGAIGTANVLEYTHEIKIYQGRHLLVSYPLPPIGTRNEIFPKDRPHSHQPHKIPKRNAVEEDALRCHSKLTNDYLDALMKNTGRFKYKTVRELYRLQSRLSVQLFDRVIERAHHYGIYETKDLDRIARLLARQDADFISDINFDEKYETRDEYQEGCITDLPDLDQYEMFLENEDE